jgi:MFS family permease
VLVLMFGLAFALMRDVGFTPRRSGRLTTEMRAIASASVDHGWRVPAVKWIMLSSVFTGGVGFYVFYALQPYLLELAGKPEAYGIAGLVAAIVAGADIVGGIAAPWIRRLFHRRTSALLAAEAAGTLALALIGAFEHFWVVLAMIVAWSLLASAALPIRRAYLNGLIPSAQRATILSFDSLLGSSGGVAVQPALGRAADVWGYATSYVLGAAISAFALPFIALSRRQNQPADTVKTITEPEPVEAPA